MVQPRHIADILPGVLDALRDRVRLARILDHFKEDETRLQAYAAQRLTEQGFRVFREVTSVCGACRIDLVVDHETDAFRAGVEIKVTGKKRGKEMGDWLAQAARYDAARFLYPGSGGVAVPLNIYVFPQWCGLYFDEGEYMHPHRVLGPDAADGPQHNVSTFLGSFGIGEVQLYSRKPYKLRRYGGKPWGWRFVRSGRVLWSTDRSARLRAEREEEGAA